MHRHSDYPSSSTTVAPFPKIVALCGAHTALGQNLLRDLLHSEEVEKVHALAVQDIPLLDHLPSKVLRKSRVTIVKPDRVDKAMSRIAECDIAFCVLTTERHASSSMSTSSFHTINYSIPTAFVRRMFALGVLHLSLLSHVNADADSRSEFYSRKAELETYTKNLRRDAAEFSPIVSIFKMPTHLMASSIQSASTIVRSSSRDRKSMDRRHRENNPPVKIEDVAVAMQIDAFDKANCKPPPSSRRKKHSLDMFGPVEVHHILATSEYTESW